MEVTPASAATTPFQANSTRPAIDSDFETFLRMLTVQMQNQDPLDPVKSEDFAVQLATFSGVEQQVQTNNLIESLIAQNGVSNMAQYAGWVGMEARAPVAGYFDGNDITITTDPPVIADAATLVIYSAAGTELDRIQLSPDESTFVWDGKINGSTAAHGHYSFVVESSAGAQLIESRTAEVYTRIVEARSEGGEVFLMDAGGLGIRASEISALR